MRALVLRAFGGPEQFRVEDWPTPEPGPGAVRVRIHAASLNQVDIKIREGLPIGPTLPAILGADMAGVDAADDGRYRLKGALGVAGFRPVLLATLGAIQRWAATDRGGKDAKLCAGLTGRFFAAYRSMWKQC